MTVLHLVLYSLPRITVGYTVRTHAILREQKKLAMVPPVVTPPRHPGADDQEVDGTTHYRCRREAPRRSV